MFNSEFKTRLGTLEAKIAKAEQENACVAGDHTWELRGDDTKALWIRCRYCYKMPEKIA